VHVRRSKKTAGRKNDVAKLYNVHNVASCILDLIN
jgi:hypothetical protein